VNADESEPETCKEGDFFINKPHKLIENYLIVGYTIRGKATYILEVNVTEIYNKKLIRKNTYGSGYDFDICVHKGAGGLYLWRENGY